MRVSGEEILRLSQIEPDQGAHGASGTFERMGRIATAPARLQRDMGLFEPNPLEAHRVAENADMISDVREDVVASLRARIEAGTYLISGEQIAEMLVRRFLADRIR
jgi:hypothetical protein